MDEKNLLYLIPIRKRRGKGKKGKNVAAFFRASDFRYVIPSQTTEILRIIEYEVEPVNSGDFLGDTCAHTHTYIDAR